MADASEFSNLGEINHRDKEQRQIHIPVWKQNLTGIHTCEFWTSSLSHLSIDFNSIVFNVLLHFIGFYSINYTFVIYILIKPVANTWNNLRPKWQRCIWPQESLVDSAEATLIYSCGQLAQSAAKALGP